MVGGDRYRSFYGLGYGNEIVEGESRSAFEDLL